MMARGVFAFVGDANVTSMSTVASYSNKFHMPYVSSALPTSNIFPGFLVNVRPRYDGAILALIRHYKWRHLVYIYDSREGVSRLQELFNNLHKDETKNRRISVVRVDTASSRYPLLRHVDRLFDGSHRNIVLDVGSVIVLQSVLNNAMDELNLDRFTYGGVNLTGFGVVRLDKARSVKAIREWCRRNKIVGLPTNFYFDGNLQLNDALTLDALTTVTKGLVKLIQQDPDAFRTTFRRGQVYNNNTKGIRCNGNKPWQHGPAIISRLRDIGSWHSGRGLSLEESTSTDKKSGSKVQQRNRTKIVTTILTKPYLMLRRKPDDGAELVGNDRFEGYCADVARMVAEIVKFDYELKVVADEKYGERMLNGTWNGMVGELTDGKADLAIAPLTITSIRERVIDFSKPYMSLGISIMIKKPDKQKPGIFSFMNPLAFEIWMYIILAYLGVSLGLFLVSRFSPYEWQIEDSVNGSSFANDFTVLNSFWFALSAIMRQGCDISPRSMSGRIVGAAWWFFTLILISSYTANLVAFLTVERMLTPIESADDLAKQTEILYGTLHAGSTKDFFYTSRIAVYKRMWDFMESARPPVFVSTTTEGVHRVRDSKGKYAFLLESTMNDYYNQQKPCNTMKVGGNLDSKGYGVATPLDSELREPISLAVLQLRESGYLQKLHKKWWYDKGECGQEVDTGSQQSALTLNNVAGIFYILIGGLGVALIFSIVEFFCKTRMEARRQKASFSASIRMKTRSFYPRPTMSDSDRNVHDQCNRQLDIPELRATKGSSREAERHGRPAASVTWSPCQHSTRALPWQRSSLTFATVATQHVFVAMTKQNAQSWPTWQRSSRSFVPLSL
ncbi:Glutamate receptor 4 [Lamellibrachia satsuma]|nr:Glutamate receptor 4 [Lamellibrachia satsuma]